MNPRHFTCSMLAAGFNLIDTADIYSRFAPGNQGGESETIIGKWFRRTGNRKNVVLATKVGMEMGPEKKGLSKPYILSAVEDSLRRLQTDYIDLYQSHTDDTQTSLEKPWKPTHSWLRKAKFEQSALQTITHSALLPPSVSARSTPTRATNVFSRTIICASVPTMKQTLNPSAFKTASASSRTSL